MFEMKNSAGSRKPNLGVFHVSCWVLGLVGFVQMMAVGVAMAFRNQRMPEPDERIVKEYVMVPAESRAPVTVVTPPKVKRAPIVMADDEDLIPDLGAVAEFSGDEVLNSPPPVLDPVVEELLKGARDARIQGDHALAHSKLSEAQLKAPEDPNVLYGLGVNFEDLGITDKATVYYKAIYKAGPEVAGSLFEKAAIRLAHGLVPNVKDLAKLGWGRMTTPSRVDGGEKRTMILPVHVSPTKNFDPMLFKPRVRFYEEVNGKISQAV
ncbi:MAG: hypothetical protein ACJA1W_000983, partial [Akkermansiaceae bacterium]